MSKRLPIRAVTSSFRSNIHPIQLNITRKSSSTPQVTNETTSSSSSVSSSSKLPRIPIPTPALASKLNKGKGKDKEKDKELPYLPRPLGTPIQPTSKPKTWGQRKNELLDEDRHKAKRRALLKEASQGYFHDYNAARQKFGGKLWLAPNTLIREDRALYFPNISGRALSGDNVHTTDLLSGKISIVSILNTRLSEEHVQSFTQSVLEDWEGKEDFNFVQINHQRNPLKSMLLSLFTSSLKRTIPESRWGSYLITGGEWNEVDINYPLGLENKILGYIYLVDSNLKIRWAGNAQATPEESANLRRATAVLMGRMRGDVESINEDEGKAEDDNPESGHGKEVDPVVSEEKRVASA